MIGIASRTGTRITLAGLRHRGWWLMVSAAGVWRAESFDDWVAENGAFTDYQQGKPFNETRFAKFIRWVCAQPVLPKWIALPDIVCGGAASLALSIRWIRILRRIKRLRLVRLMLVVQDGMDAPAMLQRIRLLVGPLVGIFLGGETEWKLATCRFWGAFCQWFGLIYHVGRVNSQKRIELAGAAEADSFDGTSVSRFFKTLAPLDCARRNVVLKRSQLNWLEAA